jgi:hypothetical protein
MPTHQSTVLLVEDEKGTHPAFLVNLVGSMTQLSSHCPLVD